MARILAGTLIKQFNAWLNIGFTAAMMALIIVLSTGCASYTVKGVRSSSPAGAALDKRFTLSKLQAGVPLALENALFGAGMGMNDINLTHASLREVLCKERPDLFVKSGGIPFGVVATFNNYDWPGDRYGTFALYILSLGCWPISLEGRLYGNAYLYASAETNRVVAKAPITMGYKCNLSVFTPIGLISSVNGFHGYNGEEVAGPFPTPDQDKTKIVLLSEIARGVADVLTTDVRTKLGLASEEGWKEKQVNKPTTPDDNGMIQALRIAEFGKRRAIFRKSYDLGNWQKECGALVQSLTTLARCSQSDASGTVGNQFKNKEIAWELEFLEIQKDKAGKELLLFDLEPAGILFKFFSGKPVMMSFEPSAGSLDAWKTIKPGSLTRISGIVGDISLATMTPGDNPNMRVPIAFASIKNVKLVSVVD